MTNIDYFKLQAKNLLKDFKTQNYNEEECFFDYSPRFFNDINDIVLNFDIDEESEFTLMNAQHIIAKLSGFTKWNELIKASDPILEIGKLLLDNREQYQEEAGYFTNMVENLIVDDWKSYEEEYLSDADDDEKLKAFKENFLINKKDKLQKNNQIITLDFKNDENAQDMLTKIMKKKNLTSDKALLSCITQKNCLTIISTGWAGMAVSLWGHADPDAKKEKLEKTKVVIKLSESKKYLVSIVMQKEKVDLFTALQYFMIFQLESFGYHI